MRRPETQWEHMEQANVRGGYNPRRPEEYMEAEMEQELRRTKDASTKK